VHKLGRRKTLCGQPAAGRHEYVEPDLAQGAIRAIFQEPPGEQEEGHPARILRWQSYPLLAVLMIALGALGYGVYLKWRTSQAPASVSDGAVLALRAERRENALRVSWNRDAPVVNHARDAVLSIRDGDSPPRELHFNREQLRNGSVIYSAANDSVQFRLEVTSQDNTKTSETILTRWAPKAHLTARLVAASRPAAGSSSRNRGSFIAPAASSDFGKPGRAVLVDPPSFSPQAFAPIEQLAFAQPKLPAPPPPESQQRGITPREPQEHPDAPAYFAAQAIRESLPNLPPDIRAIVTSEVEVQVKVQVDESGRVVRVDPVGSIRPASGSLVSATREAALLWRFAPPCAGISPSRVK
jgi:hypothetical protein